MMKINFNKVICISGILLFASNAWPAAQQEKIAYLSAIDNVCKTVTVRRQAATHEAGLLFELHARDVIYAPGCEADPVATLQYLDGEKQVIGQGDLPFTLKSEIASRSVSGNILNWALNTVGSLAKAQATSTVATRTRGGNPVGIPWAAQEAAMVAPHREQIAVYWISGKPPFSVTVLGAEGETLERHDDLQQRRLSIDFPKGQASISVLIQPQSGDTKTALIQRFTAAEWQGLTAHALAGQADPAQVPAEVVSLALLASEGQPLLLEAYQYVAAAAPASVPDIVRASFEDGSLPGALPAPQ